MCTYLNVSINLDPFIELPSENSELHYEGAEDSQTLLYCAQWIKRLAKKFPSRNFNVFGENLNGQSVLIPRYLRPMQPPKEVLDIPIIDDANAHEKVAKFVSLIPFVHDIKMF